MRYREGRGCRFGLASSLVGLGLAATFVPARAEEESVFTLGEIRVTAPAREQSTGASSVSADDIERFDRTTVGRAIEMLPGVTLSRMGNRNEETAYVRGFDLRQTTLLIDGIPVYVPYDGNVDLGRFTTFDVSKIQVSKGWSSVLDGPNALGGAINLVSWRPTQPYQATLQSGLRLDGRGGLDGYETAASVAARRSLGWAQLSGSWLDLDDWRLSDDFGHGIVENGGIRDNSDAEDWKVNVKLALTPREADTYSLNFVTQHGEKGAPPYAGDDPAVRPRYWRWPEWDKKSLYWLSQTSFDHGLSLETRAYYDTFENTLDAYDDAGYDTQDRPSSFRSFYDDYSYGGSSEGGWRIDEQHELRTAFHYKRDVHREHNRGEPERTMSDDTWSTGLAHTWQITPAFELVSGVGYDWRKGVEAEDYQRGVISDLPKESANTFHAQAAAIYHFEADASVHLSASRRGRFPTLKERYSYRMGTAIPNPDLDPETALHFELGGTRQFWGHTRVDAALFWVELDDAIQEVRLSPNLFQVQNVGEAVHRGFELDVGSFPVERLELGLAYTFLDRRNRSDGDLELVGTPKHALFGFVDYEPLKGVHLVPSVQVASSRHLSSDGERGESSFVLADVSLRWQPTERVTLAITASNLLDEDYELSLGFPEQGRNYAATVALRY